MFGVILSYIFIQDYQIKFTFIKLRQDVRWLKSTNNGRLPLLPRTQLLRRTSAEVKCFGSGSIKYWYV